MPCCKRTEVRRVCRPMPSLLARLNCTPCNRVLFFMIGVGLGVLFVRNKDEGNNKSGSKKKDDGKGKK
ncbi:uncharacterized protein LOC108106482 [Drosophila eugracilis]|uniref:uncharacterized protein LOC108106482 n=1 Tax=Drosophila eugracilis TaxID=29029 RepID=UPI0007E86983|nr:uncharacterized protein LOC108106482 [Drosophila eugracilis]